MGVREASREVAAAALRNSPEPTFDPGRGSLPLPSWDRGDGIPTWTSCADAGGSLAHAVLEHASGGAQGGVLSMDHVRDCFRVVAWAYEQQETREGDGAQAFRQSLSGGVVKVLTGLVSKCSEDDIAVSPLSAKVVEYLARLLVHLGRKTALLLFLSSDSIAKLLRKDYSLASKCIAGSIQESCVVQLVDGLCEGAAQRQYSEKFVKLFCSTSMRLIDLLEYFHPACSSAVLSRASRCIVEAMGTIVFLTGNDVLSKLSRRFAKTWISCVHKLAAVATEAMGAESSPILSRAKECCMFMLTALQPQRNPSPQELSRSVPVCICLLSSLISSSDENLVSFVRQGIGFEAPVSWLEAHTALISLSLECDQNATPNAVVKTTSSLMRIAGGTFSAHLVKLGRTSFEELHMEAARGCTVGAIHTREAWRIGIRRTFKILDEKWQSRFLEELCEWSLMAAARQTVVPDLGSGPCADLCRCIEQLFITWGADLRHEHTHTVVNRLLPAFAATSTERRGLSADASNYNIANLIKKLRPSMPVAKSMCKEGTLDGSFPPMDLRSAHVALGALRFADFSEKDRMIAACIDASRLLRREDKCALSPFHLFLLSKIEGKHVDHSEEQEMSQKLAGFLISAHWNTLQYNHRLLADTSCGKERQDEGFDDQEEVRNIALLLPALRNALELLVSSNHLQGGALPSCITSLEGRSVLKSCLSSALRKSKCSAVLGCAMDVTHVLLEKESKQFAHEIAQNVVPNRAAACFRRRLERLKMGSSGLGANSSRLPLCEDLVFEEVAQTYQLVGMLPGYHIEGNEVTVAAGTPCQALARILTEKLPERSVLSAVRSNVPGKFTLSFENPAAVQEKGVGRVVG